MVWWQKGLLFYAVAGTLIGMLGATCTSVEMTFRDRPVPFPRVAAFVFCFVFWWGILFEIMTDPLGKK
jgi:hypothetical protein